MTKNIETEHAARARYNLQTAICDAVRAGVAATKHHVKYTARVHEAIRKEIKFRVGGDPAIHFGDHEISVWGNGLSSYSDRIYLLWSWPTRWNLPADGIAPHWSETILAECDRSDCRDYLERLDQEHEKDCDLRDLNNAVNSLMNQVNALRAAAAGEIAKLPIPTAAKLRSKSVFWDSPSKSLCARFPALFPENS